MPMASGKVIGGSMRSQRMLTAQVLGMIFMIVVLGFILLVKEVPEVAHMDQDRFDAAAQLEAKLAAANDELLGLQAKLQEAIEESEFERSRAMRAEADLLAARADAEKGRRNPKNGRSAIDQPETESRGLHLDMEAEVDHILEISSQRLTRSKVVGDGEVISEGRTSSGVFLTGDLRTPIVMAIEERIHNATMLPLETGEGMYVLRYEESQKYDPHTDYCRNPGVQHQTEACENFLRRGGDRVATFILILKSPDDGGYTAFPKAKKEGLPRNTGFTTAGGPDISWMGNSLSAGRASSGGRFLLNADDGHEMKSNSPSETKTKRTMKSNDFKSINVWDGYCDKPDVLKVTGKAGDGVFFYSYWSNGTSDGAALHGGCPVKSGEKWIMTRWIRESKFT